ncbi:MAG TPA: NADPH-dependent FMN reductase [Phenylobacterium sp.]|nr:NADPH-dependent FMN reductase [Phenylobacterium sp.]
MARRNLPADAPVILGLGGTPRRGSSSEQAVVYTLEAAKRRGARTRLLGGEFLASLPLFDPGAADHSPGQIMLADAVREADGVILASPGYHGSLSGVLKNALDTLELTGADPKPYFEGKPVGVIVTANGAQAGGTTLSTIRMIIHAMRGWPTPFGATFNPATLFDPHGACRDEADARRLALVAEQVMDFLARRRPVGPASV